MPIIRRPDEFNVPNLFVDLSELVGRPFYLKCEGVNFAGSIKIKAAVRMVEQAELDGVLRPGVTVVESSSGNLGVALSIVAASRGYGFHCVTDSRCNLATRQLMRAMGATVEVVSRPHPERGLLGARLERIGEILADEPTHVWLNQYQNPENGRAHYLTTGPEILDQFPDVSTVFLGVGTSGTLMGTSRYLREHSPATRVVGIDSVGSVTFGGPSLPRNIPGLGSGVRPPQFTMSAIDNHVYVDEVATVRACRALLGLGFMFGGSTGTVLAGAMQFMAESPAAATGASVAVAPDNGERYLDTVYEDIWVTDVLGADALVPSLLPVAATAAGTTDPAGAPVDTATRGTDPCLP